jgi:hypothetical protein
VIRRVQGLLGLVALLVLSVGLPWALAATIGDPLSRWSSIKTGDMSDQNVIAILAAVAYLAWATFAVALAVELVLSIKAAVTRQPRRQIRIPFLGVQQDLARTLIAAVLLLGPVVASAIGPTAAAAFAAAPVSVSAPVVSPAIGGAGHTPPTHDTTAGTPQAHPARARPGTTTYRIPDEGGLRSYWALAEHYLGHGQRWHDIWTLNRGRHQPDGSVMESPQMLLRGWTVLIPTTESSIDAVQAGEHAVTVEKGDTLSGLAAEDGVGNWKSVWPDNEGRVEPGGERFTDPNLIKPGWTIVLPGHGIAAAHPDQPSAPAGVPRPNQGAPKHHGSGTTEPRTTAPDGQPVTPPTPRPGTSASAGPASEHGHRSPPAQHSSESSEAAVSAFVGGGGLLLAGVSLTALVRYRRRQFRRRHPGRTIGMTPPDLIRMERAVLGAGDAGIADVTWLDRTLRSLVHAAASTPGGRLPDVIAVRMTREELELVLTGPSGEALAPWRVDETGSRWLVRREDDLPYVEEQRGSYFAPFPTLASVGYTDEGEHWLLDLERIGALSLAGDAERCLNLARFVAAELAHNTWSEMLQVTLIGFGRELVDANPDRLSYTDDLASAVAEARRQFEAVAEGRRSLDTDVLAGRLHDIVGDLWPPHVLLIAPHLAGDRAELNELLETMRQHKTRMTVALVLADDPDRANTTRWHMTVDARGRLSIPALGVELTAHQVPAEEAAQLAQMLALVAESEDEPIPAGRGEQPWESYADACGGLTVSAPRPEPDAKSERASAAGGEAGRAAAAAAVSPARLTASAVPLAHAGDHAPRRNSVLPLSPQTYLEKAATTEEDVKALAPAVDDRIRAQIEEAVGNIDGDLAAWYAEQCPRPRITLLGDVAVRAQGALPERSLSVTFATEAVVYLATRPNNGVLSSVYAQMMWPNEPDVVGKPKVRQSIRALRRWLGTDPVSGQEYLPSGQHESGTARYFITGALVDAELFRRLRTRGLGRGPDGIDDLWEALELVQGHPFGHLPKPRLGSPGGYLWLTDANVRLEHEYAAMIVDTAHTAAGYYFGIDEPQMAVKAAHVALRSGTYEDVPLLDLVQACMALQQEAEAESYLRQIMNNHDAEVEEDLPPRTAEVLFRLRRQWDERAS